MNIKLHLAAILLLSGCATKYEKLYQSKPAFYSYIAGDVNGEHITDEYFSQIYATPASCQKVVTSLVGLKTLGPNFKYKTKLFVTKKNGQIHDVIIKFFGDPTLTSEKLFNLLQPLQNSKINGQIILDAASFQTAPYSHNLVIDDIGSEYATPVSAINIDKNLLTIRIYPEPQNKAIKGDYPIDSAVVINDEKSAIKLSWLDDRIEAKGHINKNDSILELKISPRDADYFAIYKIKSLLKALNIEGKITVNHEENFAETEMELLNEIESASLQEIIKPALKISDNLFFDSLYLTIINASSTRKIKDWEEGSVIFKSLINHHFALDINNALIVDGSGLSRYNRIQPFTIFSLLKQGFLIPEFVDALAKPGEENSSLKNRLRLPKNILAKTGNMSGISCLCGYALDLKNPQAFVFMANNFAPPSKELFEISDNFLQKNLTKVR